MSYDVVEYTRHVQTLLERGVSFVTATLVGIRGSAPQILGARAIITSSGIEGGTIGGGKIEAATISHAQDLLQNGGTNCELVIWNLQTDIGMTCGGEVRILFEVHANSTWPIAVFGAGHVAQALVRCLVTVHCSLTCVDPRQEWLDKLPDSSKLSKICAESPEALVSGFPMNTFFVLMSKGHATDLPVLAEILKQRQAPYVGVIGSKQKASVLRRDLAAMGLSSAQIASFHCPMGLPIGNNTPAEIAISITAQLLEQRDSLVQRSC